MSKSVSVTLHSVLYPLSVLSEVKNKPPPKKPPAKKVRHLQAGGGPRTAVEGQVVHLGAFDYETDRVASPFATQFNHSIIVSLMIINLTSEVVLEE